MEKYITHHEFEMELLEIRESMSNLHKQFELLRSSLSNTNINSQLNSFRIDFDEQIKNLVIQLNNLKKDLEILSKVKQEEGTIPYIDKTINYLQDMLQKAQRLQQGTQIKKGRFVVNINEEGNEWTGIENVNDFYPNASLLWSIHPKNIETRFENKSTFFNLEIMYKNNNSFAWKLSSYAKVFKGIVEIYYYWS